MTLINRFLRYVQIDTQSDERSTSYPSTVKQLNLLNLLVEELIQIGASDVEIDAYGYVTARVPANCCNSIGVPPVAFIAHVDTSSDVSGHEVSPRIIEYSGGDLVINSELNLKIGAASLNKYIGHNLVVTDGTTLLGADDKAGVAEIMTALEYLISNPQIEHGDVWVLFTPDEEVGRGVDHFNTSEFAARYAYTVDGGEQGSLEWETFNAASADITVSGINYHPGYANGKMINSQHIAMKIAASLPHDQRPEYTSDREGFFHLTQSVGSVEQTKLHYIIRDHNRQKFEQRKQTLHRCVDTVCDESGIDRSLVQVAITDQYYNMGEVIKDHYFMVEIAEQAMHDTGICPMISAVRGGTDGSRLSFMGLPCANIFSGAENIHSRLEFVSEQVMVNASKVILNIIILFCEKTLEK